MPSSRVYHHEEDAVNNLTALINPKIDVRDNVKSGRVTTYGALPRALVWFRATTRLILLKQEVKVRERVTSIGIITGTARKKFTSEFRIENCQSKWSQNVTS
ncbi:uncharacterized protein HRG_09864 [Hirsutella rhossiliensis]|uniref:Uncharacterized protein n=1 Tax=Hirsutella rhossiliensis TaxID=111463 RepID=A0A9P8SEC1_9HYPO|nr:uncharacterized protein HRG_09864 [Hirsutella rhossiliensis]KAH0958819.1 hypothetical protein HRG_09864 [Hirsutella rhossiliensis]